MQLKDKGLLRTQAYINGAWRDGEDGALFPVFNPADGEVIAEVEDMGAVETEAAIQAAQSAFADWKSRTAAERAALLMALRDQMLAHREDLALIMTCEQGKPLAESRGEINYAASFLEWFAEEGKRIYGDVIPSHARGKRIIVLKQPIGVAAAITPWNFPSAMITRKLGPALATGCTFVLKPAEDTPLSALALAELAQRAGFPPGVFNVIPTSKPKPVGEALTKSPIVRKLSFTGSTEVGKLLMAQSADSVKKVSLELGGNAPFIVFDDADLDAAVKGAIACKYRNAGQTCVCANRFLIQDGVYDAFVEKFTEAVAVLKVGAGLEEDVSVGPLINKGAINKVTHLIQSAVTDGAEVRLGGQPHDAGELYYQPTILTDVTSDMEISRQEIFGPVAPLTRFSDEEEAIRLANDTPYGLAAYFYASGLNRVFRVAEALEYGMVGVNEGILSTAVAPFGGVKESGSGREGSKYGIDDYLEIKYLCLGGSNS